MKKRILLIVLICLAAMLFASCDEKEVVAPEEPDVPVKEDVIDEPAVAGNATLHENTYFSIMYDEAAGWSIAEDDVYTYDTGGNVYVRILDEEGNTEIVVYINAEEESPESFRKSLYVNGFDQKAYADGTLETTDVGGQPMLYVDQSNGDRFYFGRNEAAGVYYTIDASNWDDPRVPKLIEGITCTADGTDNVDPPWSWEGEAFSAETVTQLIGTHNLTAQFLPMSEPLVTYETFLHDAEVIGDKVYLLSDYVLREYTCDGASLTFSREIPLDTDYEVVESANGDLVLSNFMEPLIGHDGENALYSYEGPDYFTMAPDGTWGISWFSSGETTEKYTFSGGALVGEPMPFAEVQLINQVCIDDSYIYVTGSPVDGSGHFIFVYDHSGSLQMQLTGDPTASFGLGSVTYVTKTANGFIALDGNMRDVVLWTPDGTWIGSVDTDDLFGADYPWLVSGDVMADGSILCVMTQDRADESAMELVAFKLSGF